MNLSKKADFNTVNDNNYSVRTIGITKKYGDRVAVNGVDLSIKKGELFALLGANGAGKTTLIKMLCCLLQPTAGTAEIMGHDISKNPYAVKEIIDVSPQETAIAGHLTVLENLQLIGGIYGLSKQESRRRAIELIEVMGLTGREKDQARKLSGGLQRRLSIAMALISDPQVLFLDEPTLGLDPQARKAMWREIEKFKGKKTIFLTTHYLEEADALADRIAIMNKGEIIALDTPEALKKNLYALQTMVIKADSISGTCLEGLRNKFSQVVETEDGVEISGKELNFEEVVDYFRSAGVRVNGITMKEPSLDDVFMKLIGEEISKCDF